MKFLTLLIISALCVLAFSCSSSKLADSTANKPEAASRGSQAASDPAQRQPSADITSPDKKAVSDSSQMPVIDIRPMVIHAKKSEGRFIQREVKVLNRGAADLKILNVLPSCKCSSATVMDGTVAPMTIGKIRLAINQDGMAANENQIEFLVESNAKNSPVMITIILE